MEISHIIPKVHLIKLKKNGTKKLTLVSLKKEISSNIVKTKARHKKIKKIFPNVDKKLLMIYF